MSIEAISDSSIIIGQTQYVQWTLADAAAEAASYTLLNGPSNGQVTINQDGSYDYIPDRGFSGADSFTYEVADAGETRQLTVNIQIEIDGTVRSTKGTNGNDVIDAGFGGISTEVQVTGLAAVPGSWQTYPDVVQLDNGYTVMVWTSQDTDGTAYNIYARVYDEIGEIAADNIEVNSTVRTGNQERAVVTDLGNNQFAVTWQSESGGFGSNYEIYTRNFYADGSAASDDILVGSSLGSSESVITNGPDVSSAALSGGSGHVVTWSSYEAGNWNVYAVNVASDGTVSAPAPIDNGAGDQRYSRAASDGNGGYLIVYQSSDGFGSMRMMARHVAGDGTSGAAFQINSDPVSGNFIYPSVTLLEDGSFVAAWASDNGDGTHEINMRRFNTDGSFVDNGDVPFALGTGNPTDFSINGGLDVQVTALSGGNYLVTWQSYDSDGGELNIYGQEFIPDGMPASGIFLINTDTDGRQWLHAVAPSRDGGFISTWSTFNQGINAQVFNSRNQMVPFVPISAPDTKFQINTFATGAGPDPAVTTLTDGGFVVIWESSGSDPSLGSFFNGITGQRFDAYGRPVGDEFLVTPDLEKPKSNLSITALDDGGFEVRWDAVIGTRFGPQGLFSQLFNSDGQPVNSQGEIGYEENLLGYSTIDDDDGNYAELANGWTVEVWDSYRQDWIEANIFGKLYDESGNSVGAEFLVNISTDGFRAGPSVAALNDGGFVVTWTIYDWNGSDDKIVGQRFNSDGQPVNAQGEIGYEEFEVSPNMGGNHPSIAALADGGFVVIFKSVGPDGTGIGFYAQLFDRDGQPLNRQGEIGYEEIPVSADTNGYPYKRLPLVVPLADGGFTVIWSASNSNGEGNIYGRRFDADGNSVFDYTNRIEGFAGNDLLGGDELREDIYIFGPGFGQDTIRNNDLFGLTNDRVIFEDGIDHDELWLSRDVDDLLIDIIGAEDQVRFEDWFVDNASKVDQIVSADSYEMTGDQAESLFVALQAYTEPADASGLTPEMLLAMDSAWQPQA